MKDQSLSLSINLLTSEWTMANHKTGQFTADVSRIRDSPKKRDGGGAAAAATLVVAQSESRWNDMHVCLWWGKMNWVSRKEVGFVVFQDFGEFVCFCCCFRVIARFVFSWGCRWYLLHDLPAGVYILITCFDFRKFKQVFAIFLT